MVLKELILVTLRRCGGLGMYPFLTGDTLAGCSGLEKNLIFNNFYFWSMRWS